MARLLNNLISASSSATKIRKIKEEGFNSENEVSWDLTDVENVVGSIFVKINNSDEWVILIPRPDGSTAQRYNIIGNEETETSIYFIADEDPEGEYIIKTPEYSSIVVPSATEEAGVQTGNFQEKNNLILNKVSSYKNIHYYPLASFTDFYILEDVENFQPFFNFKNADLFIKRLSSKRHPSITSNPNAESYLDEFTNGFDHPYFYPMPFFTEKGASPAGEIHNLLHLENDDLKYADAEDHINFSKQSFWDSCWSGCTEKNRPKYSYADAVDGIYIKPDLNADTIFSKDITLIEAGTYCFSFFIKLDDTSEHNDNAFTSEFQVGFYQNNAFISGTFLTDDEIKILENNCFITGEMWKRISLVTSISAAGNYTLKITWPVQSSQGAGNKRKRNIGDADFYTLNLRVAGLLLEKENHPSVYDPAYVSYLAPGTSEENHDYFLIKPSKENQVNLVFIGENFDSGNNISAERKLEERSFDSSTYTIVYRRYIEGRDVCDNIGNGCKLKYIDGIPYVNNTRMDVARIDRGFRSCVWETVVFQYKNSTSEESVDIYYPEDIEPRFTWKSDIYNGDLNPINIKTGITPDSTAHAYLLFGTELNINSGGISEILSLSPAYYKDLTIIKGQEARNFDFKKILRSSLFRLKLIEKQTGTVMTSDEGMKVAIIAENLREGSFNLNKIKEIN